MSVSPAAFQESGLAANVWKLLRLRLVILMNGFRRAKTGKKIAYIASGIGILAFLGFVLFLSVTLLIFIRSPRLLHQIGDPALFLNSLPAAVLTISVMGILFTCFGVLLQVLYLSGDMDFLMSAPVPIRAVFAAKMVQAVLPNFTILCALTLPVLFGFGISSGYGFLYYPLVLITLAAITLAAASLAGLLVLVVVRFFSPRRVAEVLGFVVGMTIFLLSQSGQFMKYGMKHVDEGQVAAFMNSTAVFRSPWSPLAWAGRGLIELGEGDWIPALGLLAASLTFAGLIFCIALITSERLYYTGWAGLHSNRRKSKNKAGARPVAPSYGSAAWRIVHPLARVVPAPVRAVVVKDLRLFRRDLSNLSSLLFPLILGVVYAVGLLHADGQLPAGRGTAPPAFMRAAKEAVAYGDIFLALFLGLMLASNLAGFGFSREGKNYWLLKAAPIHPRRILAAKFLAGYIPSALVCSIYLLILEIFNRSGPWPLMVKLISVWMILAGLTGLFLALGTGGAKFNWENPSQINRTIGCLGMLSGVLYLGICIALFTAPMLLAQFINLPAFVGPLAGLLFVGVAGMLGVFIPLGMAERRVANLAEDG
jgi:ABC-2 type transport system permease protein